MSKPGASNEELEESIRSELQVLDRLLDKEGGTSLVRIGSILPGDKYQVPLFVVYEWELFVAPPSHLGLVLCYFSMATA